MRWFFRAVVITLGLMTGAHAQTSQDLLVPAASQDLIVREDFNHPRAQERLDALMEPILPLMAGDAGSTTSITQIGRHHFASSSIEGAGSLSLIDQSGARNRAVQAIQGNNSALLLVQGGSDNNVLQASIGDDNFQLVGVSGQNNNVGYVQIGNDLAGALDVRGAQNATVLALQTPVSGNYLMPTGLRGLKNATVVIVPGRMYVLRK